MKPKFTAGENIAMKVPVHEHPATVAFYRDVLGFEQVDLRSGDMQSVAFKFGDKKLWIDEVQGLSQAELWLEIIADDTDLAAAYFEDNHCIRRDEIEPLPQGFKGFWIASPANIIHLITATGY